MASLFSVPNCLWLSNGYCFAVQGIRINNWRNTWLHNWLIWSKLPSKIEANSMIQIISFTLIILSLNCYCNSLLWASHFTNERTRGQCIRKNGGEGRTKVERERERCKQREWEERGKREGERRRLGVWREGRKRIVGKKRKDIREGRRRKRGGSENEGEGRTPILLIFSLLFV